MHNPKHHCLDLGARLNKKEKANQIPILIFLFFLTVDAVWSATMSQASATMQSCCLDVPTMPTIPWGCEPRQNFLLSVAFATTTRQVINTEINPKIRARRFLSISEVWPLKWYPVVKGVLLNYLNKETGLRNR